jgi:hypothetical protein
MKNRIAAIDSAATSDRVELPKFHIPQSDFDSAQLYPYATPMELKSPPMRVNAPVLAAIRSE